MKKFLTLRLVSSIEASSIVMAHHFVQSTFRVIFLKLPVLGNTQFKFLKPKGIINAMKSNDAYFFKETQLKYYLIRPVLPEFEFITIIEYFSNYEVIVNYSTNLKNNVEIKDTNNNIIEKRKKPAIIRYIHLNSVDGEKYYYQQLLIHTSYRDLKKFHFRQ